MSSFLKKTIQTFLIVLVFFSINNISFAQEVDSGSVAKVDMNMSPSNPRAGESIVLTLSSDLINLDSSKIVWYVNDIARKSTSNKSITIKADFSGNKMFIRAVIETSDGIVKEVSREISPAGIDLVIEPLSYTLPFYKGKSLLVGQGSVRVVAIADVIVNGVKIPSWDLIYRWTRGETVLGTNSGKGKNSVILSSNIPVRDINISLQVLDDLGNVLAETSKLLILNSPKILFYEDSPLYGILYNKAIVGNYFLGTREELKIVAKPFSFSFISDIINEAVYTWSVNGNPISQEGKVNEILLKQTTTNLKGTASISVNLKHNNKINQFSNGNFNVDFGE